MDKKELFDALDDFSQQLLATLADVEAIKKNLKSLVEENTALRLENSKLRERIGEVETDTTTRAKHVRESVHRIYKEQPYNEAKKFLAPDDKKIPKVQGGYTAGTF